MAEAGTTRPTERELHLLLRRLRRAVRSDDQVAIAQAQHDFPNNKNVLKYSGVFHFRRNELAAAEDALVKAVVADPGDAQAVRVLMRIYYRAGKYDNCEAAAQELLRLEPDSAAGLRTLGVIYSKRGAWTQAVAAWKNLATIVPDDARASLWLARTLKRQKAEAQALGDKAMAADPQNHGEPVRIETVISRKDRRAGGVEPITRTNSVDDQAVIPLIEMTPALKGRTTLRAGMAAAVLLLAVGGGCFMLASKPVLQDLKVEDSDRMLAEQRAADVTTAEKRLLEEKARRQAEADVEKAQQERRQEAATEAEAKRQADEAQAERQKAEAAAKAREMTEASIMQTAKEEKKAEAPESSKADEQSKAEGEGKALASQPPAPSPTTTTITPTPITQSLDGIRTTPVLLANPYDGSYAGIAKFPSGPQSLSLRLVNGEGKGSWNTSCGATRFTLTIRLNGEANLSVGDFRTDCSRSSQSLRGRVEDGQLKFLARGLSGDGVVSFTKSEPR